MDPYNKQEIANSALFLARRKNQYHPNEDISRIQDYVNWYDYFLIYAVERTAESELEFVEILDTPIGLKGLYVYYGSAFSDFSKYTYLNSNTPFDSVSLDWSKMSYPIIFSGGAATVVLRNYNGKWIELTERDR